MKVNEYALVADCVERGITIGWERGHEDGQSPAWIQDRMAQEILDRLCEFFVFSDGHDDE